MALAPSELRAVPVPDSRARPQEGMDQMPAAKKLQTVSESSPKKIDSLAPDKVSTLVEVWRQGMSGRGFPVPAISMKAKGQLKHLIGLLPAGEAPALLAYTMQEWSGFVALCADAAGAFSLPAQPEIGFLLKHVGLVPGYVVERKKLNQPIPKKVQSIAPMPVKPFKKHVPATMEEMWAIHAEFEAKKAKKEYAQSIAQEPVNKHVPPNFEAPWRS